jgi:hypothetical protein
MAKDSNASRKLAQGYLASNYRPACGNCSAAEAKDRYAPVEGCGLGNFPVAMGGWCPCWAPNRWWIKRYPEVAERMDHLKHFMPAADVHVLNHGGVASPGLDRRIKEALGFGKSGEVADA